MRRLAARFTWRWAPAGAALAALMVSAAGAGITATGSDRVSATTFGHSVRDRPLEVRRSGPSDADVRVLVVGLIHGNETAGQPVIRRLRNGHEPTQVRLWTVRDLNPDGDAANTRQNARGVDLNRNFPNDWREDGSPWSTYYSGPEPASEPETRAAIKLIKRIRPHVTVWYHQQMNLVVATRGVRKAKPYRRYAHVAGMRVDRLAPLHGTATGWQNNHFANSSAFVVELPAGSLSRRAVRRHADAVLAAGRAAAR